jgi:SagB-type dehydrogenase family enzyme
MVVAGLPVIFLDTGTRGETTAMIKLPEPKYEGRMAVELALRERRSIREYQKAPLTLEEVSQLLWAAQGITHHWGLRTAPSAGALYPLEMNLVAGQLTGLPGGVYRYHPKGHELARVVEGDKRAELALAALGQSCVRDAAVVLVISAVYERTTRKYGDRGIRYVHMEVGHAAQNVALQAVALNLGAVMVGAFRDAEVKRVLQLGTGEEPLYLLPVGRI